jgi:hypothetical protein
MHNLASFDHGEQPPTGQALRRLVARSQLDAKLDCTRDSSRVFLKTDTRRRPAQFRIPHH